MRSSFWLTSKDLVDPAIGRLDGLHRGAMSARIFGIAASTSRVSSASTSSSSTSLSARYRVVASRTTCPTDWPLSRANASNAAL
jgi:hypothetical protein